MRAADKILLDGRFFRGDQPSLVILASGYGDTQDQMLSIAEFLHQAGFSVVTYNSRARATSGGEYVTLGVLEPQDLLSIIGYVVGRKDVDEIRLAFLGISMGAAIAILGAAKDKRIKAVVDDSGFSDAPRVIAASSNISFTFLLFHSPRSQLPIANSRAGIDVNSVRPMDVIGEISPRPLLVIHETDDVVVPVDNSLRTSPLPAAEGALAGAGKRHGRAHTVAKSEYEKRVAAFFQSSHPLNG